MCWTAPDQGAEQLADNIPGGPLWWASDGSFGNRVEAVVGNSGSAAYLLHVDLMESNCQLQKLNLDRFRGVCEHNGVLWRLIP